MKFIVKAFDLDGREMEFGHTVIGEEKEVAFEHLKAAEVFFRLHFSIELFQRKS